MYFLIWNNCSADVGNESRPGGCVWSLRCRRFGAWTRTADFSWSTAQLILDPFPMRKIANVPNQSFILQSHQTIEPSARRLGAGRVAISQTWHEQWLRSVRSHQRHFKNYMRHRPSNSAWIRKLGGMSVKMQPCVPEKLWCHQAVFRLDAWLSRWPRPGGRFGSVHICVITHWKIIKRGLFPLRWFQFYIKSFQHTPIKDSQLGLIRTETVRQPFLRFITRFYSLHVWCTLSLVLWAHF